MGELRFLLELKRNLDSPFTFISAFKFFVLRKHCSNNIYRFSLAVFSALKIEATVFTEIRAKLNEGLKKKNEWAKIDTSMLKYFEALLVISIPIQVVHGTIYQENIFSVKIMLP